MVPTKPLDPKRSLEMIVQYFSFLGNLSKYQLKLLSFLSNCNPKTYHGIGLNCKPESNGKLRQKNHENLRLETPTLSFFRAKKLTPVLGGQPGKFPWILSGPSQNEEALDFLYFKMKNLIRCLMAFNRALTKRKEHITHRTLAKSRVTWQSQTQNGVYTLWMWIAREITVKTTQNFPFRTKNLLKWMILESKQRNEEKGSPIKLHIEFYF